MGEDLQGVLDVQHTEANAFTIQDVQTLELIANQVAVALRNARQFRASQTQAKIQAQINRIVEQLQQTSTVEEAINLALSEITQITTAKFATVRLKVNGATHQNARLSFIDGD